MVIIMSPKEGEQASLTDHDDAPVLFCHESVSGGRTEAKRFSASDNTRINSSQVPGMLDMCGPREETPSPSTSLSLQIRTKEEEMNKASQGRFCLDGAKEIDSCSCTLNNKKQQSVAAISSSSTFPPPSCYSSSLINYGHRDLVPGEISISQGDKQPLSSLHQSDVTEVGVRKPGSMPNLIRLLVLTLSLLALAGYRVESYPMSETDKAIRKRQGDTVKYLAQFGYLKGPSRETEDLRSQEDLTRAIKALQRAGNIPQTGVIDSRTQNLMHRRRCGNQDDFVDERPLYPDPYNSGGALRIRRKRYTPATSKWDKTNLTFRFHSYPQHMEKETARRIIQDALRVWSDATPLSFTEVRDSSADIVIMFAKKYHSDGYPFDGQGMVLGHAFFPGKGKGGDTHFDDDEPWTANSSARGVDLFMVAAHEFGHALGLAHSGYPSALMYPWYMGFEGEFRLPQDDYSGITSLYGTIEANRRLPDKGVVLIPKEENPTYDTSYDIEPEKPKVKEENSPPDPCRTPFDAITVIRNELFIFIGKWFWRLDSHKVMGKPLEIHQFWNGLAKSVDHVDAVFEQPGGKIVFLSDNHYWIFNGNHVTKDTPPEGRSITDFGIPQDVKRIDAAFVWGYNRRTYLVSGDMYWKMDEDNKLVEYDYPRDMGTWKGVPVPLDAAFTDWLSTKTKAKTYFFKGLEYWEFYDLRMETRRGYPKRTSRRWITCPEEQIQRVLFQDQANQQADQGKKMEDEKDKNSSCHYKSISLPLVLLYAVGLIHGFHRLVSRLS